MRRGEGRAQEGRVRRRRRCGAGWLAATISRGGASESTKLVALSNLLPRERWDSALLLPPAATRSRLLTEPNEFRTVGASASCSHCESTTNLYS